jgi:hypothetical protein
MADASARVSRDRVNGRGHHGTCGLFIQLLKENKLASFYKTGQTYLSG